MEANKNKRTKLIITAVVIALVAAIAAIIYITGSSGRELKKQLDLGHKYLLEQNYEQAIVCFKKAIEIDPMCEEAYLSMADAYVGIDDFDNAMSLLEEAIKLFEDNGLDATALKDKLAEITRLEKEKAEEEERKRIAELPYIEIQPILDCLDNVWGRKWTSWTLEDYINKYNLDEHGDESGSNDDFVHGASFSEDGDVYIYQMGKTFEVDGEKHNKSRVHIDFINDGMQFRQDIKSNKGNDDERLVKDYLYNYTSKNGIVSIETAKKFWGIENDEKSEINSDFGIGRVWFKTGVIRIEVNEYAISIGEYDDNENDEIITTMYVAVSR